jgi:alpha-1,2-mannosyltransferase
VLWFATATPLFVLYLLTLRVHAQDMSIDPVSVTSSAWQLAHHGTPRLPTGSGYYDAWMIRSGPGHVVSNREPGLVGLAAVFYWLMPWTTIYNVAPASIAAALLTAAAMGTLALVLRRLVEPRVAWFAALAAGTATSTWAVSSTALWPHGPDQLYLAGAMLALASRKHLGAGLGFAFAVLTRPPLALVAAVTGLWASFERRSMRPGLAIGVVTSCGLAAFLVYSHAFWGGGLQSQYVAAGGGDFQGKFLDIGPAAVGAFLVNVVGTLVSPGRGVLIGSPFLLVLIPGLRPAWRQAPPWVRSSAVAGLLYMLVQLKANRFSGGTYFWGYRYPIEALTLLAPLLVLSWRAYASCTARRRAVFATLLTAAITLQAVGAFCFGHPSHFSDWTPYDFATALRNSPVLAGVVCLCGYIVATIAYRLVSRSAMAQRQVRPTEPAPASASR